MTSCMVFSSVGDNTIFDQYWIKDQEGYDIYIVYYDDSVERYDQYKSKVKFAERRKGSKFQNFYWFYKKYPEIIQQYEYFFILDDDIVITGKDIQTMFKIVKEYNLLIAQPSFTKDSKISWPITKHKPGVKLEYTNFVEVNTQLFHKSALTKLMDVYDPILIGWGIDYLAIQSVGKDLLNYAIIHCVQCKNPRESHKQIKTRELFKIPNADKRQQIWETFAKERSLELWMPHKVHKTIPL